MGKWPVHAQDEIDAVVEVLRSGATNFWTGTQGVSFESEFAAYTGARFALAVSSGTTALEVAIESMGPPGGDVIIPCRTFVATASAVYRQGHKPILADINGVSLNVTVETLEARRTERTVGVVVVHYAGRPCNMPAIMEWALSHKLWVVEDAAHAHGSRIGTQHVGTFGHAGCFSMCVGKTMSTGGEGGMILTDSAALQRRMTAIRDHGRYQMAGSRDARDLTTFKYTVEVFGSNARMTEMQSAIGRCQLKKLDGWVSRRRDIGMIYDKEFCGSVAQPAHVIVPGMSPYMYLLPVTKYGRPKLLALADKGVRYGGCPNIGVEPVFRGEAAPCPVADAVCVVSLPIYPTLTDEDVAEVIEAVREAM